MTLCRPAYPSVFAYISTEISQQFGCMPVFLKIQTQSFQKVRTLWRERCEFGVREADRRALMGNYRSLTFAYFKPFPGLKYMAGPDWSKKFVSQWTMTLHQNFTEVSYLPIWRVWSCQWYVAAWNRWRGGRMYETKETNSNQTTTIRERMRQHQWKQHTWCIVFGESVLRSLIKTDFRRCKQNKVVWV